MDKIQNFGKSIWDSIRLVPLGSLSKRELELLIMKSALDASLIENHPAFVAEQFKLSLTKANGYLTDISLRNPIFEDKVAVVEILKLIPINEILTDDSHFSIPVNNASLRIWLERKMVLSGLNPGESLRKDLIKITPAGLCRILDKSEGIISPKEAIDQLSHNFGNEIWFKEAQKVWKPETKWKDALSTSNEIISMANFFSTILPLAAKLFI
jgi:antibiotic biosynthesis monooxygenase (ABM) superfamily enzyme